ncbi:hypothetical protein HYX13_00675 [Candidatus Woesearchaeota archaeon]|nr:hypothetical protein [Candidatus Woesearchaeota archaeon]
MGWLKEKLLQGKKLLENTPQKEYLQLQELQPWLQGQAQRIIAETKLEEALASYIQQLQAKRWQLEIKLEEWKNLCKDINNEMRDFFTEIKTLIHLLTFPEKPTIESVSDSNKELGSHLKELKNFLDSYGEKEYSVLLPDGREAEQVIFTPFIKELLELEKYQQEFDQKIIQSRFRTLELLQEKRQQLESATQTLERLQEKITAFQLRVQQVEEKKQEKAAELEQWKQHPSFGMFLRLEENRKVLKQGIVAHQDEVVRFFSQVTPVLDAFKLQLSNPKLVDQYVQDPESAFFHDEQLAILHLLQQVKALGLENPMEKMHSTALPVTLQQTTSFLEKCTQADVGHVHQLRQRQQELQQQGASIAPSPEEQGTLVKMEDAQYRLEHFSKQVAQLQHQQKEIEEQQNELQEQRAQEIGLFQHLVKMGFGKEVEVKV